jgi:hypothetical protein
MSKKRRIMREKSSKTHIEAYHKIQTRYDNMFNLFVIQPLEELERIKNEKRSHTDRTAFDNAYKIVKKAASGLLQPNP